MESMFYLEVEKKTHSMSQMSERDNAAVRL